ncbi:MAG: HAD family hydrolase [Eubacterium sp.]|nr:HAD family hydrolase [Eubacterium sp.]
MRTLYVSDLDGTLLRSDEATSAYTNAVINRLTGEGMIFSYATARSLVTAKKVTKGLDAKIPLIVYNGAFVMDNVTEQILISNYFEKDVAEVFQDLFQNQVYPIVYSYIGGVEKFSFIPQNCTKGMVDFLRMRKGDKRTRSVETTDALTEGRCFYITCIGQPEKLEPLYEKYKAQFHCVYQRDIYTNAQWLEIMPRAASKANAVVQLKELLGCDRVVAFGDGKNDLDLFEAADEGYAVANAVDELKAIATGVISSNQEDGVARWLEQHFEGAC